MSSLIAASGALATATVAETKLRAGDLDGALEALIAQVRSAPRDAEARVFLFQLLAATGQWTRARAQLDACQRLDPSNAILDAVYGDLLTAEEERAAVFSGKSLAKLHGSPEPWASLLTEASLLDAQGEHVQASVLRAQAFEAAPAVSGRLDGVAFTWLADADPCFGPCMEAVVEGQYVWMPYASVSTLKLEPPGAFCDTLWIPAHIGLIDGGQAHAFLFARYPGSEHADDPALKLGRLTDWMELHEGTWAGIGQRMLITESGEHALLDIRSIEFDGA